jgi:hypothetical protein
MPDGSQISQELRTQLDRIEKFDLIGAVSPIGRMPLDALVDEARATVERLRAALDTLYETAVHSEASAPVLLEVAAIISDKERADTELLRSRTETLLRKLAAFPSGDPEVLGSLEEFLGIAKSGFALHRTLHDRLLELAAERRATAGEILRARPVKGEIDYPELSRDTIAKFPKILAALAK